MGTVYELDMRAQQAFEEWMDLPTAPFDLRMTLESGQVFHWEVEREKCVGIVEGEALVVRYRRGRWQVQKKSEGLAVRYFSLDHPLERIWSSFPEDRLSQAALKSCRGLRIIRQPRWECLATFITSPLKQIVQIRKMSLALRKKYGNAVRGGWTYPSPEVLACLREEDLRVCGLGFRARNLLRAARVVAAGDPDLEGLGDFETDRARELLMRIPGVGEKVANCVLLFAYERLDVVPVDVWMSKVLRQMRRGRSGTPAQLREYSRRHFGPYAGYVQQYLFHYARTNQLSPLV